MSIINHGGIPISVETWIVEVSESWAVQGAAPEELGGHSVGKGFVSFQMVTTW